MKKTITAALAALALVGGQAAASSDAVLNAGDRLGSHIESAQNLEGIDPTLLIIAIFATAAIIAVIVYASDDDSPSSP